MPPLPSNPHLHVTCNVRLLMVLVDESDPTSAHNVVDVRAVNPRNVNGVVPQGFVVCVLGVAVNYRDFDLGCLQEVLVKTGDLGHETLVELARAATLHDPGVEALVEDVHKDDGVGGDVAGNLQVSKLVDADHEGVVPVGYGDGCPSEMEGIRAVLGTIGIVYVGVVGVDSLVLGVDCVVLDEAAVVPEGVTDCAVVGELSEGR